MPRRPRIIIPGVPVHIIQRGNNRQACFYVDEDYQCYLKYLKGYAGEFGCTVHAYVLMSNHVHLLLTPADENSAGTLMKHLGQRYVQYINRTHQRSGTLWEGRFRSCIVQQEIYLFICQRYIELNPVRAMMVDDPGEYRWSSFRANAQGENDVLLSPHSLYMSLGQIKEERETAYRELFRHELESVMLDQIRRATNGNFTLGNECFNKEISIKLGRRVTRGQPGRPRKRSVSHSNE